MKAIKLIKVLVVVLLLFSCKREEHSRIGYLDVDVRYSGGANQWELDGVKIALRRTTTDFLEQQSVWIDKTGRQRIELPFGRYELVLNGNRCKLINTDTIININPGESTLKAITIEHLGYSVVVKYKDKEMNNGDTIMFGSGAAIDIWNKYSSNDLKWTATTFSSASNWIKFIKNRGMIEGHKTDYVLFEILDAPNYGANYADIVIATEDEGTFSIVAGTFKPGGEPEQADITGDSENICPAMNVILTAKATGATSYKWYKGDCAIEGQTGNTYEVTQTGIYYAVGVNTYGSGIRSVGKDVTISTCVPLPGKATISGEATNSCIGKEGQMVLLTAQASGATSFIWRKDGERLNVTSNVMEVSETGVYSAAGQNESGVGEESSGKSVLITSCIPGNPLNVQIAEYLYTSSNLKSSIKLSWNQVDGATGYKIQVYDDPLIAGEFIEYGTDKLYYEFYSNQLPCGKKYFKIIAWNDFGESSGTVYPYIIPITVKTGDNLYYTRNAATGGYNLNYIDARIQWYRGIIYFEIQRSEDGGAWEDVATITGDTERYPTGGYHYVDYSYSQDAETVKYRVRAYVETECGEIDGGYVY